ncbi:MAG: hypothetical protein AAFN09_04950 [Pseudomonadota bacterium]
MQSVARAHIQAEPPIGALQKHEPGLSRGIGEMKVGIAQRAEAFETIRQTRRVLVDNQCRHVASSEPGPRQAETPLMIS